MKHTYRIGLLMLLIVLFVSTLVTTSFASSPTYKWKLGSVDSRSNPNFKSMEYLVEKLEEKAPGKWKIELYPDGLLGDAAKMCDSIQMGTLELTAPPSSTVANYVPEMGMFDMPYLFTSYEQVDAVLDGEIGQALAEKISDKGMKLLAYWEVGFRCLANNKRPVESVDDVAGLRLRVMSNVIQQELWLALGADPVPMSLSEAYIANQNGTIDGQDNPLHSLIANSTYEVCKYVSVTNHIYTPMPLLISPRAWDQMTTEDQNLFMECVKDATSYQRNLAREQTQKAEKALAEEYNITVSHPDLAGFESKMGAVYDNHPEFKEYIDQIKNGN